MGYRDSKTLDLFGADPIGAMETPQVAYRCDTARLHPDIEARISQVIAETLRESGKTRSEIAKKLGVTEAVLNNWASPGREKNNIPLAKAIELIAATGDPRVIAAELAPLGFAIVPEHFLGAIEESIIANRVKQLRALQKEANAKWRGRS
ncbi:MAG: phage regulatory CII family protein [Rhodospirillaceae bacterium]